MSFDKIRDRAIANKARRGRILHRVGTFNAGANADAEDAQQQWARRREAQVRANPGVKMPKLKRLPKLTA